MVNKKLGLLILSVFGALMLVGITIATITGDISPKTGEVGTEVTVTINDVTEGTYSILFNGTDMEKNIEIIGASTTGFNKFITPERVADDYLIEVKDSTSVVIFSKTFTVTNSKPIITTDSLTSYVGSKTIDSAVVTDKNGKELVKCEVATSTDLLINNNIDAKPNDAGDACVLTFKDGKEPKSSNVGTHTIILTATDKEGGVSEAKSITLTVKDYLEIGTPKLKDLTGSSTEHMPGDTIELTIKVRNLLSSKDIDNVVVNIDNNDLELDKDSDEITISDNDEETVTLTFEIPFDAEKGTYSIKITADGEDEDGVSRSAEETYDIKVTRNAHSLTIKDLTLDKSDLTCGDKAKLSFSIYNNGEKDEDNIVITLKNTQLGILKTLDEFDINSGDEEDFTIDIEIPAKAYDKTFEFTLEAKYGSLYATDKVNVAVANCDAEMITLGSEVFALSPGDKLEIPITLENIGSDKQTYEIRISGLEDIGTYEGDIDLKKISVDATSSTDLIITLTSNSSAATGSYDAELELYVNGEKVASKPITLTVKEGGLLTGFAIFGGGGVGLSIVLILVIGAAGYLAYTLWLKKLLAKKAEEEEAKEEELEEKEDSDEEDEESKIVFDDEEPKKKKKRKRKK